MEDNLFSSEHPLGQSYLDRPSLRQLPRPPSSSFSPKRASFSSHVSPRRTLPTPPSFSESVSRRLRDKITTRVKENLFYGCRDLASETFDATAGIDQRDGFFDLSPKSARNSSPLLPTRKDAASRVAVLQSMSTGGVLSSTADDSAATSRSSPASQTTSPKRSPPQLETKKASPLTNKQSKRNAKQLQGDKLIATPQVLISAPQPPLGTSRFGIRDKSHLLQLNYMLDDHIPSEAGHQQTATPFLSNDKRMPSAVIDDYPELAEQWATCLKCESDSIRVESWGWKKKLAKTAPRRASSAFQPSASCLQYTSLTRSSPAIPSSAPATHRVPDEQGRMPQLGTMASLRARLAFDAKEQTKGKRVTAPDNGKEITDRILGKYLEQLTSDEGKYPDDYDYGDMQGDDVGPMCSKLVTLDWVHDPSRRHSGVHTTRKSDLHVRDIMQNL